MAGHVRNCQSQTSRMSCSALQQRCSLRHPLVDLLLGEAVITCSPLSQWAQAQG